MGIAPARAWPEWTEPARGVMLWASVAVPAWAHWMSALPPTPAGDPVSEPKDPALAALIGAVTGEDPSDSEEEEPALSGFGERLRDALEKAVAHLRAEGMVEVEEELVPSLVAEVTEAGLDARSPKAVMKRVIRTLLRSEHVEEVYGTDEMLTASLRAFLDPS